MTYTANIVTTREATDNWTDIVLGDAKQLSGNMDILVNRILSDGYSIRTPCLFSRNGNVRYVRIDKYEYRILGVKTSKKPIH